MIKSIGFLIIILGLMVCLQPNLFFSSDSSETETTIEDINPLSTRGEEKNTEYAEGYSEEDFGEAFTSPMEGKFAVQEEEQPIGPWEHLLKLKFNIRFDESVDDVIFEPKFSANKKIKAYENQVIEVEGFIIPHDIAANAMGDATDDGQSFMFSAFPLASCFFCGGAGAESVMEAFPKDPINYTKKKVKVRGRLEFNSEDYLRLPYILKDVVLVEENL